MRCKQEDSSRRYIHHYGGVTRAVEPNTQKGLNKYYLSRKKAVEDISIHVETFNRPLALATSKTFS